MVPAFLQSTYKKYKSDTSTFIQWLFETGTRCGYKIKSVSENPDENSKGEATKVPRLKGRARKEAREASKKPSTGISDPKSQSKPETTTELQISTKDLMSLAKAVARSEDSKVIVPTNIIQACLRAISSRKKSNEYFKTNVEDAETAQSNESHSYFISLMEQLLLILQPRFASTAGTNPPPPGIEQPVSNLMELENRFASLEVEEPAEVETETIPGATPKPKPVYTVKAPDDAKDKEEDKVFAIFCLLEDLQALRRYVAKLWKQYKEGEIDLITASVTTNTAFQLAMRTQDEILVDFPAAADYQEVLKTVIMALAVAKNSDALDGDIEYETSDEMARWLFAPMHSILDNFCDVLVPGRIPIIKRGYFGVYDPYQNRGNMIAGQQNLEDVIIMMEILPEFCLLSKCKMHMFASDEMTNGLRQMALTKKLPVWLIFAATCFLEIHHILRENVERGWETLKVVGKEARATLDDYFELSDGLRKPSTWPKHNEQSFRMFREEINRFVLEDAIFPEKRSLYKQNRLPIEDSEEIFYLYKRHPILCGMLAFSILLEMQSLGIIMCNAMGTILYPAQFYNTLRQKEMPCQPWPLMEMAIALHGEDEIFVGGRPDSLTRCWQQICLTLGYSASTFARNRRAPKPVASKKGPRGLKETSPLSAIFHECLRGSSTAAFTLHNVEQLLKKYVNEFGLESNEDMKKFGYAWSTKKGLSSIELLVALRGTLPFELPKLQFEYFKLHRQSITLLRKIKREMDEDYKAFFGPMYLENESQLPWLGPWAIMAAIESNKVADSMKIEGAGSKLLLKAGDVLDDFVAGLDSHDD